MIERYRPPVVPPPGYVAILESQRCACASLWQDEKGQPYCCGKRFKATRDMKGVKALDGNG
jgi:hypothetical protein